MSTVPLGENPYLYQGGPTVPLRQQKTGAYAANSFGNRVFYTPEGRLPNSTLAPGLAPTPGALVGRQLSGAGLAGAAIGGALQTQAAYSQGAGLFEGLGTGVGATVGAIGGQFAGASAGAAVGGAAGSAIPGVGNVAGAGAGTVAGAIGGGLAGGAVGGSVGGGIGRAIDDLFWPDPAKPAIGIPDQPKDAKPQPGSEAYPNQFPAEGAGAGPTIVEGTPPPFTGGQSPVGYRVTYQYNIISTSGLTIEPPRQDTAGGTTGYQGPIQSIKGAGSPAFQSIVLVHNGGMERTIRTGSCPQGCYRNIKIISVARVDGLPDTGGDPPGGVDPVLASNPARPASRPLRTPYRPASSGTPSARPTDRPWPERAANPVPYADPIAGDSPFKSPAPGPNFSPTPDPLNPTEPAEAPAPTQPRPPLDPLNPVGPSTPIDPGETKKRTATPFFIPIPIPTQPFNRPDFKEPDVPVTVPVGFRQPAITPTGDPGQLINPTTTPTANPNVNPQIDPVQQPARIEEGKCCIPPANPDIVKRLEQIKKGIGFGGLPVSVPDQIAKTNPVQQEIGSLAELHIWQVRQLDGLLGRWPQNIPIPTPTGVVNVGMPNVSETMAEMIGMMVSQQVTAAQILNTTSRGLHQAGSATQQAHVAQLTSQAIADFLGFESRPTEAEIPLAYTPGANPFDGFLNESTQKIRGFENTDKQDLKSILAELLQAAAIIRAVFWRQVDTKGDLTAQIKQNIKGQGDFIDKAAETPNGDKDWEAYLKQVEEGFKSATGEQNPYNRPPAEGPQIKDRSPKDKGK